VTLTGLYKRVPSIACKGHCWHSCGPIVVGAREHQAMQKASGGKVLALTAEHMCGFLTADRQCEVYAARPLICRLWGVVPEMPCPWGCATERVLTKPEATVIFRTLERIGGQRVFPVIPMDLHKPEVRGE
jgi:hypothetical protein